MMTFRESWRKFCAAAAVALLAIGISLTPTRFARAAPWQYCSWCNPAVACDGWCWTTYCTEFWTSADVDPNGNTVGTVECRCAS